MKARSKGGAPNWWLGWPAEVGNYWFYGQLFDGDKPSLHLCKAEVVEVGHDDKLIVWCYDKAGYCPLDETWTKGYFTAARLPPPPSSELKKIFRQGRR